MTCHARLGFEYRLTLDGVSIRCQRPLGGNIDLHVSNLIGIRRISLGEYDFDFRFFAREIRLIGNTA